MDVRALCCLLKNADCIESDKGKTGGDRRIDSEDRQYGRIRSEESFSLL